MNPFLLKAERKLQGWSQAQVAEALGISARTLRRWEQGLVVPYPYYRERLCALFGKTAEELGLSEDSEDDVGGQSQPVVQEPSVVDPTIPQTLEGANSLLGRNSLLSLVKQRLLQGRSLSLMALDGLPGIGETALAAALAMDKKILAHFTDGILWAGLGNQPDILSILARWGKLLGVVPSQVENLNSRESWRQALRAAIGSRRLLLIIDDALNAEDIMALQVGGTGCIYLVTTRLAEVAFTQQEAIVVPRLEEGGALALLAQFVPELVEHDLLGARALVQAADGLPLTLTLIGHYLASQNFIGQSQPLQMALAQFCNTEQHLHGSLSNVTGQHYTGLTKTVSFSLLTAITLCYQRLSPQAQAALSALASVFRSKPHSFSEEAALAVSQQPLEILDELWDIGLLESCGTGRYTLHQTIANYACALKEVPPTRWGLADSLVGSDQLDEQEIVAPVDHLSFSQSPRDIHCKMKILLVSGSFKRLYRLSWNPMLFISIILLTVAIIIAVIPAFIAGPLHQNISGEANNRTFPYSLTIQNGDPSLQEIAQNFQNTFNAVYPQLVARFALHSMAAPKHVVLKFSSALPDLAVASGTTIIVNTDWIRGHPTDMGLLTSQLTSLILQYPTGTPTWFISGIADYARSVYGPADDADWFLPDSMPQDSYTQGSVVTARFLQWLELHTTVDIVDQLNHALQTGLPVSDAFLRLTHETLDKLWGEYQAQPDISLTPEQLYHIVTTRKPLYQSSMLVRGSQPSSFIMAPVQGLYLSDFAVQAKMTIIHGDGGGFIFRAGNDGAYRFCMSSNGAYDLVDANHVLVKGFSPAIKKGLRQTNLLTIIAQKHTVYVYVNRQLVTEVADSALSYGALQALALDFTNAAEVYFDDIQIF